MKELDNHGKKCEQRFGLISGFYLTMLHELSTAEGSEWDLSDPNTMDIVVTKRNAALVYAYCKEIRKGYSVGVNKGGMDKIKAARMKAHRYLYDEANDPATPIERKIELVRLTSKD